MNPFADYSIINAEDIVRANISPTNIETDTIDLINALKPVTYLTNLKDPVRQNLHRNVIQKLTNKSHTLDLLKKLGYDLNPTGEYGYQQISEHEEIIERQNAVEEFQRFYQDLQSIKTNSLPGFKEFIKTKKTRRSSVTRHESIRQQSTASPSPDRHRQHSSSSSSFSSLPRRNRSPSETRLPDHETIRDNNQQTIDAMTSFKESLVTRHEGLVAHSFIRRKLLTFLFNQTYPDAHIFGDTEIDSDIDGRVSMLKQKDPLGSSTTSNEIYFECLIRTNCDLEKAHEMLRHNRPNLMPPPEPELPRGPTTTTLTNTFESIGNQWTFLTDYADQHQGEQVLVHAGDEWKNTAHVVTAILQVRQKYPQTPADISVVNKMYRFIFSELSCVVGLNGEEAQEKIRNLAEVLCEVPFENLEHLNMADLRDIILSCGSVFISDDYKEFAQKFLSRECPICFGSYANSYMQEMFLCAHKGCLDCVKNYYRDAVANISDLESLNKLTCFEETHQITEDTKLNFFTFLGTKMNQWFTDERRILDLYHENLYMATRDTQDTKCGNPRCTAFFSNNNNNQVARVQCPHCEFQQCRQCGRKWNKEHTGKNCHDYAEWLKENDPDDPEVQLNKYLNTAGMACPNEQCGAIYEYQPGGCEHFRCPACSTEFCRICSALYYNPAKNTICPRPNCSLKKSLHAHCCLNCFREIRDAENDEIIRLLTAHRINVAEELQQKPPATSPKCPVDGCTRAASATCENRFCDTCYKQFLCLLVWRNQIEPWELYTENNLRQKLTNASVNVPAKATRENLIALAKQHLTQFLGKPKKIQRK